jgi:hypothetical protein
MHRENIVSFVERLNFYIVAQIVKWSIAYYSETSIYMKETMPMRAASSVVQPSVTAKEGTL